MLSLLLPRATHTYVLTRLHVCACQFDRDVRALSSMFVADSTREVRDRLVKLGQVSQLLNLTEPKEVRDDPHCVPSVQHKTQGGRQLTTLYPTPPMQLLEYWGENEGPTPWQLSAEEVKQVLCTSQLQQSAVNATLLTPRLSTARRIDFAGSDVNSLTL